MQTKPPYRDPPVFNIETTSIQLQNLNYFASFRFLMRQGRGNHFLTSQFAMMIKM